MSKLMKKIIHILILTSILIVAGCSSGLVDAGEPSVETTPTASPHAETKNTEKPSVAVDEPTPSPTDEPSRESDWAPSPTEEPSPVIPSEDIPDIVLDTAEKSYSAPYIYEDDEYIYTWIDCTGSLAEGKFCIIRKDDNRVKETELEHMRNFVMHEGAIYYIGGKYSSLIIKIDVHSNKSTKLLQASCGLQSIAVLNNKIYFGTANPNFEWELSLYTCNLDGSNITKMGDGDVIGYYPENKKTRSIRDGADSICVYNDMVFAISAGDVGSLVQFYSNTQVCLIGRFFYEGLNVSYNKIVCFERIGIEGNSSKNLIYDIKTQKYKYIPHISTGGTLIGQYMIFTEKAGASREKKRALKAYDILEEKEYTLLDLRKINEENERIYLRVSNKSIYLFIKNAGLETIYRVEIKDGMAQMEHVATIDVNND